MIQELTIKNFLSFKDATTFSFEATDDNTFEDWQVVQIGNTRLLRFSLVYGANASGKSNLLAAFEFLRNFWFRIQPTKDTPIGVQPFMLDRATPSKPSCFELVFFVGTEKYKYELELDNKVVYSERLWYYKTAQPTLLLNRTLDNGVSVVKLHSDLKVSKKILERVNLDCLPNMSFFGASDMLIYRQPIIGKVQTWMEMNFAPAIKPDISLFESFEQMLTDEVELKAYILDFLRCADTNITNITTKLHRITLSDWDKTLIEGSDKFSRYEKNEILKAGAFERERSFFEHVVRNGDGKETYSLPSSSLSRGTKQMIGLEVVIFRALLVQAFLVIDEMETSLHPRLLELVLTHFLQKKSRSQLLVTTNYDPLLDEVNDILRKDMVWFTEKGEDGATELYSLADFKRLNTARSLCKHYRNGRFGAVPNIG